MDSDCSIDDDDDAKEVVGAVAAAAAGGDRAAAAVESVEPLPRRRAAPPGEDSLRLHLDCNGAPAAAAGGGGGEHHRGSCAAAPAVEGPQRQQAPGAAAASEEEGDDSPGKNDNNQQQQRAQKRSAPPELGGESATRTICSSSKRKKSATAPAAALKDDTATTNNSNSSSSSSSNRSKSARKTTITQERIDLLDSIGFDWRIGGGTVGQKTPPEVWNERLELLRAYRRRHGNCRVPQKYVTPDGGCALGVWVNYQKQQRQRWEDGKPASITRRQMDQLDAVGLEWSEPLADAFEGKFQKLLAYRAARGHCRIPKAHETEDGIKLGRWLGNTRRRLALKAAADAGDEETRQRIERLQAIGAWGSTKKAAAAAAAASANDATAKDSSSSPAQTKRRSKAKDQTPPGGDMGEAAAAGRSDWNLQLERYAAYQTAAAAAAAANSTTTTTFTGENSSSSPRRESRTLERWAQEQRARYRLHLEGKQAEEDGARSLSVAQIEKLNAIQFDWNGPKQQQQQQK